MAQEERLERSSYCFGGSHATITPLLHISKQSRHYLFRILRPFLSAQRLLGVWGFHTESNCDLSITSALYLPLYYGSIYLARGVGPDPNPRNEDTTFSRRAQYPDWFTAHKGSFEMRWRGVRDLNPHGLSSDSFLDCCPTIRRTPHMARP